MVCRGAYTKCQQDAGAKPGDTDMTDEQRITIERRAYNDCARSMQSTGITMTHVEADALGDDALS